MADTIRSANRALSITDSHLRGAQAARGFQSLGSASGAAVAILLRNDLPYFEIMTGARLSGAYAVPVNWHFTGAEVGYILRDSNAQVLVIHADLLPAIEAHVPEDVTVLVAATPPEVAAAYAIPPQACAAPTGRIDWNRWLQDYEPLAAPEQAGGIMLYTSGTTGQPKGVRRMPLPNEAQGEFYQTIGELFGIRSGMRAIITGPLYHSAPNAYASIGLQLGCELLLMPRFDAEELLRLIEAERLTHMHMVPTMFVRLLQLPAAVRNRYDTSSLECVIHGAAPCPVEVKQRMIDWWGPVIREYYGSTEGSLITTVDSREWLARPGTVGRACAGARIRIYDEHGQALPTGETGEIYMRQTNAPDFTYHNRDAERRAIERDDLITNGDVGYLDNEGYLFICDRKRDLIISGGVNIYPAEIEAVLIEHPGVRDCAVFGIPDPEFGEAVAAAVEPHEGRVLNAAELRAYLGERLAKFKLPATITFHAALPREDSGKIFKRKLRDPYWQDAGRRI